jgi:hypothetical protein
MTGGRLPRRAGHRGKDFAAGLLSTLPIGSRTQQRHSHTKGAGCDRLRFKRLAESFALEVQIDVVQDAWFRHRGFQYLAVPSL